MEAKKIISEAHGTALLELASVKDQARDISLTLSEKILDRVLTEFFTKEEKNKIFERNVKRLSKYD